jgi:ribose transport system substrate-binding protein
MNLRRMGTIGCAGMLALLLSACGSSGGSAKVSGTSSSAPASGPGNSSASMGPGATGIQYTMAGANALVDHYAALPTGVGVSVAMTKPAPRDKTIISLDPGSPVATAITKSIGEAAKVLGWKMTRIVYQPTPEGMQSAMSNAIQEKPSAIVEDGMGAQILLPFLKQMKDAGIAFVSEATAWKDDASTATDAIETSAGPDVSLDSAGSGAFVGGDLVAAWAITKSNGHVNALTVDITDYPVLLPGIRHFEAFLKGACPSTCKDQVLNVKSSDIGTTLPTQVVSALQRNPDINYINCTAGQFCIGVASAVKAAGFTAKIIGAYADQASLQDMRAGGLTEAMTSFSFQIAGWRDFDAALRVVAGEKIVSPSASGIDDSSVAAWTPAFILTQNTAPSDVSFATPTNYKQLFENMWHVTPTS